MFKVEVIWVVTPCTVVRILSQHYTASETRRPQQESSPQNSVVFRLSFYGSPILIHFLLFTEIKHFYYLQISKVYVF